MDSVTPRHIVRLTTLPDDAQVVEEERRPAGVESADERVLSDRASGRLAAAGVAQAQSYLEIERC
jgi:hypothetical protein